MPPRRAPQPAPPPFAPAPEPAAFRDLLIFEERLKQNAARLIRRRRKYGVILSVLLLLVAYLSYRVFLLPPPAFQPLHYAQSGGLLFAATTVFLFFASGMYAERIGAANRFVPQANRALRPFNLYLNVHPSLQSSLSPFAFLSRASSSAAPGATSVPAGLAPPTNPRGELVFASRVAAPFREGYVRYRNAFERRRREKLDEKRAQSGAAWLWSGGAAARAQAASAAVSTPPIGAADEKRAARTRTTSTAGQVGAAPPRRSGTGDGTRRARSGTAGSTASKAASTSSRASSPTRGHTRGAASVSSLSAAGQAPASSSSATPEPSRNDGEQAVPPPRRPSLGPGPAARAASLALSSGAPDTDSSAPLPPDESASQ
ncbi:hypothetical protein FA09DRAFT_361479 [Tilletiopsis washingtonensis]|uniref:Transmembrane protein 188 n=1 Tax=Tilletiopsis washingtonensis TaxID=58919 RepID=A0A316ZAH6_9BASI|nr:hypothetical protein FA09DRAFT_361479 [Tilletiopsis washingtonensis]PWN97203.1 hypothetical protein FA09DRAFT_361479 [Tilletiopsis washingtonensis]